MAYGRQVVNRTCILCPSIDDRSNALSATVGVEHTQGLNDDLNKVIFTHGGDSSVTMMQTVREYAVFWSGG